MQQTGVMFTRGSYEIVGLSFLGLFLELAIIRWFLLKSGFLPISKTFPCWLLSWVLGLDFGYMTSGNVFCLVPSTHLLSR